jgi:hypothetical protein
VVTIDVLPEDVLLTIFDFYVVGFEDSNLIVAMSGNQDLIKQMESWQSLIHVCRRWRGLVFESPRRLNLQLGCTTITPAKETLDIWPALPLLIRGDVSETSVDNVIAILEHSDRICQMGLNFHPTSQIENLWRAMQVPFPELASLYLSYEDLPHGPVLPDSLLGRSAPCLRFLCLHSIPFPVFPNRLLSAAHLVNLWLVNLPHSAYISPEAMAISLPMLTSLAQLRLEFASPQSCPDEQSRRSPPPARSVLPALVSFSFKGVNEYLEELLARISTPQLRQLWTEFFNDIHFDIPELIQFITLTFEAPIEAHVVFDSLDARVTLQRLGQAPSFVDVRAKILCRVPDWQLSSLAQICTSSSPFLSTTENLYINEHLQSQLDWKDGIENTEWLELLLPFTAVKNLYLSKQFTPRIAPALQELTGGRSIEVLPILENLFLEGFQPSEPVHEGIGQFTSARQLSNRPIAISVWERVADSE